MSTPIAETPKIETLVDPSKWVEGRVIANRHWTEQLYSLQVEAPINSFEAGQFGRLGLVIDNELVARSYSFVNMPQETRLEFYSIRVPDGPLSNRLAQLEPNDTVWVFRKAAGFLTLSQVQTANNLWMLSTGTAIGPFLSILKTQEPWQRFSRIILVHSVRTAEELVYQDLIQNLRDQHPQQFTMIPLVSREDYKGAIRGRITAAIADGRMAERTGLTIEAKSSQVMICGNPDMVRDATALLKERGLKENRRRDPGQISVERYW
ncbi:ferredoxin--NADP reductase [Nitrosococcus oceani]|uniref:ferredoxin--NADP(+) reductase n=1 Tax=Nitrosococcus oceani (strain ATCC 19707 / BCRC 17464 / JCM 30415 / NCIMB 11848 / C-107) TaxID=323261 RepID=Q3JCU7_NITOC|nr:ferredoxin--NADP reductase [Nitrosococcus oceani]ABA57349.1 Oxidoreductase FAD/NAD(P)-binding protein [Nitrosococcus oceani ATCC 19707]EDZ68267.1 Oxidoreductase NAD-binding domain protein [Nitrosococcus oceani AFC27]